MRGDDIALPTVAEYVAAGWGFRQRTDARLRAEGNAAHADMLADAYFDHAHALHRARPAVRDGVGEAPANAEPDWKRLDREDREAEQRGYR